MSDLNNTEFTDVTETTEVIEATASETATPSGSIRKGYVNKTARTLNNVHIALLIASLVYIVFQSYLSVTSYLSQMAPMGIALLYTFASVLMPAAIMIAGSFLFKFFAEVIDLMDRKRI